MKKGRKQLNPYTNLFATFTRESAYFAGLLAADGHIQLQNEVSHRSVITNNDKNIVYLAQSYVGGNLYHFTEKSYQVIMGSKECYQDLVNNWNITERKSLIYLPPKLEEPLLSHFIRGYYDGDGTVATSHNKGLCIKIVSGSADVCRYFVDYFGQILNKDNIRIIPIKGTNAYRVCISGTNQCIKIFNQIYKNTGNLYILNKKQKLLDYIQWRKTSPGRPMKEIIGF